jgi:hypothetical protein
MRMARKLRDTGMNAGISAASGAVLLQTYNRALQQSTHSASDKDKPRGRGAAPLPLRNGAASVKRVSLMELECTCIQKETQDY